MNEQIAQIERENSAFWARMLRERFGRDVTLEIDWGAFEADSMKSGWHLHPLNIQQAGIERLLYAITGLMDKDVGFKTAASDCINSIHITSSSDFKTSRLVYSRGRIHYRCFAGDWSGFFTIDQMQRYLDAAVPRRSRLRRKLDRWLRGLIGVDGNMPDAVQSAAQVPQAPAPRSDYSTDEAEPTATPSDAHSEQAPDRTVASYDAHLRAELESVYNAFLQALDDKDLESFLRLVEITKTDEESLRGETEKDGFAKFSEWLLTTYPRLERASFICLKTLDEDLAGYYLAWLPPYTREYLNLTLIKYLKSSGQWRIVFRLTEMASAAFRVRKDENPLDKALEVLDTSPLLVLERPQPCAVLQKHAAEPKLTKRQICLKEELEKIIAAVYRSLEQHDTAAFLSAVAVSQKDEKTLRKKFKRLSDEILKTTPDPSQAIFVALKTMGNKTTGYYFLAPHVKNPAFHFVYLRCFVRRAAHWKMVFSLDHDLAASLNIAKSGGDLVSRALEVIEELPLLQLDFVTTSLFDDIMNEDQS